LAFDAGDANAGDDPMLTGIAYDRNDNDPGTGTTVYGIDSGNNALITQGGINGTPSPNGGLLFTVGTLVDGLGATMDVTDLGGFDIIDQGMLGRGVALGALQVGAATTSTLFTINLNTTGITNQPTGSVKAVGTIGGGELVRAMAIAPPTIQFSAASFSVKENKAVAKISVTRTGGSAAAVSVVLNTLDGTATAGSDYTAVNQVVNFARGETTKVIEIPIINNTKKEPNETVQLALSAVGGGSNHELGDLANALLTILNDD
jgi:hypothetical protein